MEYLQYAKRPYGMYDWYEVLNLIINGIPSILLNGKEIEMINGSFKPYYKWNTFNTYQLLNSI